MAFRRAERGYQFSANLVEMTKNASCRSVLKVSVNVFY
jgi:hypothetical protein